MNLRKPRRVYVIINYHKRNVREMKNINFFDAIKEKAKSKTQIS